MIEFNITKPEDFITMPWRNGLGSTIELVKHWSGDSFQWRLSMADVTQDGAFSDFSGYDRSLPYDIRGRLAKSIQEHTIICEAILAGEGEKASELMRDHILLQGKRLPAVLKMKSQQVD